MEYFNAFQLVSLFAAGPFLITYVHQNDFYAHNVLMWVLIAGYVVGFGSLTALLGREFEK